MRDPLEEQKHHGGEWEYNPFQMRYDTVEQKDYFGFAGEDAFSNYGLSTPEEAETPEELSGGFGMGMPLPPAWGAGFSNLSRREPAYPLPGYGMRLPETEQPEHRYDTEEEQPVFDAPAEQEVPDAAEAGEDDTETEAEEALSRTAMIRKQLLEGSSGIIAMGKRAQKELGEFSTDAKSVWKRFRVKERLQWVRQLPGRLAEQWKEGGIPVRIAMLAAAVLVLLLLLILPVTSIRWNREMKIARGVTVDGVDVSRMTYEEAETALRRRWDEKIGGTVITFRYAGKSWTVNAGELSLADDLEETLEQAFAIRAPRRLDDKIGELFRKKETTRTLNTTITVSESWLRTALAEHCGAVEEGYVEGTVAFDPSAAEESGLFTITAPRSGSRLDMTRLVSDVRAAIYAGGARDVTVSMLTVKPAVTLADLKLSLTKLDEVTLSLEAFTQEEKGNALTALRRLNGVTVAAGSNYSFNATAAPYSGENGYVMIKGEDGTYTAPGVWIAASAFYRAALLANMKVITRFAPESPLDYDNLGLDAMVGETQDLAVKNTGEWPLYVCTKAEGDQMTLWIYGMRSADGSTVSLDNEVTDYTAAPETETETDTDNAYGIEPGGTLTLVQSRPGVTVRLWRSVLDRFGTEVTRELIGTDTYAPVQGRVLKSPLPAPEIPAEQAPAE